MYTKLIRRLPAGQARHHSAHSKRQFDANGSLTAPFTFTVTSTRRAPPTVTVTTTQRPLPTSSSSVVTVTTTVVSSQTSSSPSIRTSTSTTSSSRVSATATGSPLPSVTVANEPKMMDAALNSDRRQVGLPPGAIAGIVIAVLLVVVALVVFIIRRRSIMNRQQRSQSWKDNMFSRGVSGGQVNGAGYSNMSQAGRGIETTIPSSSGYGFAPSSQQSTPVKTIPRVPVPATPTSTYNNPAPPTALNARSPFSPSMPVNGALVISTFIPSLPDELSISMGETVRVLAEYDDGWVLCSNMRAETGMVPLECLSQGGSGQQAFVARDPGISRRASSLTGSSIRRS